MQIVLCGLMCCDADRVVLSCYRFRDPCCWWQVRKAYDALGIQHDSSLGVASSTGLLGSNWCETNRYIQSTIMVGLAYFGSLLMRMFVWSEAGCSNAIFLLRSGLISSLPVQHGRRSAFSRPGSFSGSVAFSPSASLINGESVSFW